ncbi:DUF202 domain-containing protein [Spirillospora sp. NPDC052269]
MERKPDPAPDAKPDPTPDAEPDPALGAKPDPTPDAKPGLVPGTKAGTRPDTRFLLANERTYLAWMRTCLAFLVGGVALGHLTVRPGLEWLRMTIVVMIIASGIVLTPLAFLHWRTTEHAIRADRELPRHYLPFALMVVMVVVGLALAVLMFLSP